MTTDKISYGNSTAITITLNSLAHSLTVGRQSDVIDNSTDLFDDALVTVTVTTSASALGSNKVVSIYVSGSEDGTNFECDDNTLGASDAGYTINSITNLKLGAVIYCNTVSKVYRKTFSIAGLYGGIMPRKWLLVATNETNQALAASGNSASYTGIHYTST